MTEKRIYKEYKLNNGCFLTSSKSGKELEEDIIACNELIERDNINYTKIMGESDRKGLPPIKEVEWSLGKVGE